MPSTKPTRKRSGKKTTSNEYFGSKPTNEVGSDLMDKVEEYYDYVHRIGLLDLWIRSFEMYNTNFFRGATILTEGEYEEYQIINVNHFQNIIKHLHNNATSKRIAFEPRSTNTDTKSQGQTLLAKGLLEYYLRDKKMERYLKQADIDTLLYGEGYVALDWDANKGEVIRPAVDDKGNIKEDELPIREGDIEYCNFTPNNIIRDVTKESWDSQNWIITRRFVNKHSLVKEFSEYEDEIIAMNDGPRRYRDRFGFAQYYETDTDDVPLYTFYHAKDKILPEGRMIKFLADDLVLLDGPLPFDEIPVYRESMDEVDDSPFGATLAWDLMPIQEEIDSLYSIVITNQKTFGVQSVMAPKGSNLEIEQAASGLVLLEYIAQGDGAGKPEPLSLLATPAEVYNFMQQLVADMETISGVNSVVRGNPEASLTSGVALALVHATALEFAKGQIESYNNLIQDVGTATINILKTYADTVRVAAISGRSNKQYLKHFTGDDIADISRVTIDSGNPLTQTTAGRVNIAEHLLQNNMISTAEEYLMVLQTGQIDPLIEGDTAELMLIREENEDLSSGEKEVIAVLTDNHNLHIREHKAVLASNDARMDPEVVDRTLAHIQEHINILKDPMNVDLLSMLGQQPLQPSMPNAPSGAEAVNPTPEQIQSPTDVNVPNMPGMPVIPGSGEYDPSTGEVLP